MRLRHVREPSQAAFRDLAASHPFPEIHGEPLLEIPEIHDALFLPEIEQY
jgi:hypothetical protein